MLVVVNLILILVIIIVIIVHIISTRASIAKINDRLDNQNPSFVDLAEFNGLDPELKKRYNTYVVGQLMPQYMSAANQIIKSAKINEYLDKKQAELEMAIKQSGLEAQADATVIANSLNV